MSWNAYELRYKIIADARDMLMQQRENRIATEFVRADLEKEAPQDVPLPSFEEIKNLAEKFYGFVKTKD